MSQTVTIIRVWGCGAGKESEGGEFLFQGSGRKEQKGKMVL